MKYVEIEDSCDSMILAPGGSAGPPGPWLAAVAEYLPPARSSTGCISEIGAGRGVADGVGHTRHLDGG